MLKKDLKKYLLLFVELASSDPGHKKGLEYAKLFIVIDCQVAENERDECVGGISF